MKLASALLLTALCAGCATPPPSDPAPPDGAWDQAAVESWLADRGHGPVDEHASALSDPAWSAPRKRVTVVQRWAHWWSAHMSGDELLRETDRLTAALADGD